jgi:type VI secretion system protein ImpC
LGLPIPLSELVDQLTGLTAELAEAVSLAIRIEPQLLRRMRIELFPSADAGVEADLWFSSVVESRAASGIVLNSEAAELLRHRLKEKPTVLEAAWRVIELLHRNISPALFAEERLAYLALSGRYDEMIELLRSVIATLVSPHRPGVADWAARAIERLPQEARYSEEAQMLAFGTGLRLGGSRFVEREVPTSQLMEWSAWLAPDDLARVSFGVALLEDAVEFGPPGRPLSHNIELPNTNPIIVELGWNESGQQRTQQVTLQPQHLTIMETGVGVTQVDIHTVLGDSYFLTVPKPPGRESIKDKLSRIRPTQVHVSYEVEVGDAIEKRELPFVVGVLANLSGTQIEPSPRLAERRFVEITADNFDRVFELMKPRLHFTVNNLLSENESSLKLELMFRSMIDFEPAQLLQQIRPLREMLTLRIRIAKIGKLLPTNSKLKGSLTMLAQHTIAGNTEPENTLGEDAEWRLSFTEAVKSVEDAFVINEDEAGALIGTFIGKIGALSRSPQDLNAVADLYVSEIDVRLSEQLSEILHHYDFQTLESTWRGLHYLFMQTYTSDMLKIKVLTLTKDELAEDFNRGDEFDQTTIFKRIYEEQYGIFGGAPFGLLLAVYEFDPSLEDLDLLQGLSHVGATSHAPFLAAASPKMLNLDNFASISTLRLGDINTVFRSPEFSKWNNFRDSEDSRYACLTLPRILLRRPYEAIIVEEFTFKERVDNSEDFQFLWGNGAFALAACVTRAFATYHWCASIRGVEGGGLVEGLPTHIFRTDDGEIAMKCPTEIAITDRREKELADNGFIPLVHCKNTDYAAFFSVQSCNKPKKYEKTDVNANARLSAQLPYILAMSRFAQYLYCIARDRIGSFISRKEMEKFLNLWIANYVTMDDDASQSVKAELPLREAHIEVTEIEGKPGAYLAIAFLRPHFQLDELTISLRVVVDLPSPMKA